MESKTFDSIELERNELVRLLSTAKDDDRREMLERSIAALDERKEMMISNLDSSAGSKGTGGGMGGGGGGSLLGASGGVPGFSPNAMRKVGSVGGEKGMLRPLSARSRSASQSNLEIIHENNSVDARMKRMPSLPSENTTFERLSEEELGVAQRICLDHVTSIVASSHDPACLVSKLLPARPDDNVPKRAFWVSTGMFPQQISIVFKEKWIIRQVEVRARGVSCMCIRLGSDSLLDITSSNSNTYSSYGTSNSPYYTPPAARRRQAAGTVMTSDRGGNFLFNDQSNNADADVPKPKPTDRVIITITAATELFVRLGCISIMAEPSSRNIARGMS